MSMSVAKLLPRSLTVGAAWVARVPRLAPRSTRESGSATVEVAVLLPALVLAFLAGAWGLGAVTAQLRCVDAAREAARALARGEQPQAARAVASAAAPPEATVEVDTSGGLVTVRVRAPVRLPGPAGGLWPGLAVSGAASTLVER